MVGKAAALRDTAPMPEELANDLLRCCTRHGRRCEPGELCCTDCTEAAHPDHADGSTCATPDLSALDTLGDILSPGWDQPTRRDRHWW